MKALFLSGGAVPYTCSETYVFYMDVRDPRLVRSQDLTFSIIFCQEDFAFTQSSAPFPPHTTLHPYLYPPPNIYSLTTKSISIALSRSGKISTLLLLLVGIEPKTLGLLDPPQKNISIYLSITCVIF